MKKRKILAEHKDLDAPASFIHLPSDVFAHLLGFLRRQDQYSQNICCMMLVSKEIRLRFFPEFCQFITIFTERIRRNLDSLFLCDHVSWQHVNLGDCDYASYYAPNLRSLTLPKGLECTVEVSQDGTLSFNRNLGRRVVRIPDNLKELYIPSMCSMTLISLPSSLEIFDSNASLTSEDLKLLPSELRKLTLRNQWPDSLHMLPLKLKSLELHNRKRQSLVGLPQSVETLVIWCDENCPITKLPEFLVILELRGAYNSPLPKLPNTLCILNLNCKFNHQLPKLPCALQSLELGERFTGDLNDLPPGLKRLNHSRTTNHVDSAMLPKKLEHLKLWEVETVTREFTNEKGDQWLSVIVPCLKYLPQTLTSLEVVGNPSQVLLHLPMTLKSLHIIGDVFLHWLEYLPSGLENLEVGYCKAGAVPKLPGTLKHFKCQEFKSDLDDLPDTLESLCIITSFQQIRELPSNLKEYWITQQVDAIFRPIPLPILPHGLLELRVHMNYNLPLEHLPNTIRKLFLDDDFDQPLNNLPRSLKSLRVGKKFNQSLANLPKWLTSITIATNNKLPWETLPHFYKAIADK